MGHILKKAGIIGTLLAVLIYFTAWGLTIPGALIMDAVYAHTSTIKAADSPYAVKGTDHFIRCNATDGAVIINLPAAVNSGRELIVKKMDSSANHCTIQVAGTDTVDTAKATVLINQFQAENMSDGAVGVWDLF